MPSFKDIAPKALLNSAKNNKKAQKNAAKQARLVAIKVPAPVDDSVLWANAMQGVRPIAKPDIAPHSTPKDPSAIYRRAHASHSSHTPSGTLSDTLALLNPVGGETFLSYKVATLQNRVFLALKNGEIRWQLALDLHGESIDGARQSVLELIACAQEAGENCVKIVHGKGDGVLKTCVNGWLRQLDSVLAFVSAPPKEGGMGTVLVLLKRL